MPGRQPGRGRRGIRTALMVAVARQRMERLMTLAAATVDPARARRYVTLAGRIAMRYNARMSSTMRASFCHSCHAYLHEDRNLRVRLTGARITRTCLSCGHVSRKPYRASLPFPVSPVRHEGLPGTVALSESESSVPEEEEEEED